MNPYMISPRVMDGGEFIYLQMPRGYNQGRRDVIRALPDASFDGSVQAFTIPNNRDNRLRIKHTWPNLRIVKQLEMPRLHRVGVPVPKPRDESDIVLARADEPKNLYDFQKQGVDFLAKKGCAILGDEMGLGKTAQSIVAAHRLCPVGRKLVVVPSTIVENWVDEIEQWTPKNDNASIYYILGGTDPQDRIDTLAEVAADPNCWVVLSWDIMRIHATPVKAKDKAKRLKTDMRLANIPFDVIIADEAHRMKNRKALQSEAIKRIRSNNRFALTGTPIMNRPDELWSILNWLEPRNFTSYWQFFEDFVDYYDGYFGKEIVGPKNPKQLGRLLASRMIRRLKKDVFKELPDKTYKTIYVDLTPQQRKAYDEMVEYLMTQLEDGQIVTATAVIAQVIRLKQICVSLALLSEDVPHSRKIDALMELVEDADGKMVVFSQFAKAIALVHKRLLKAKVPHVVLTGQNSLLVEADGTKTKVTRGEVIKAFQTKPQYRLYIGTTQAGGVGITLTAANTVVFLDKMWTPADQSQAEDRLHRIGQKDNVYVISLLAKGTVEEHIENMLRSKSNMIAEILGHALRIQNDGIKHEHGKDDSPLLYNGKFTDALASLCRRSA